MTVNLAALAAQIESNTANDEWAAHKVAFAAQEAQQEAAAYAAEMAEEAAMGIGPESEFGAQASPERVRYALENGGRAVVTVRSHKTGKHVTLVFTARKKKPGGHGWVSRATTAGRVGVLAADALEVRDPEREYPDNYVGRFYFNTGEWRAGKDADAARVYASEKVIAFALSGVPLKSDVFLAAQCSFCGKGLTDPQSIERGIGPECFGKHTTSQMAKHGAPS